MPTIFMIISMIALAISNLYLLRAYKQLKKTIENSEERYLNLAAWALRSKENGKEE